MQLGKGLFCRRHERRQWRGSSLKHLRHVAQTALRVSGNRVDVLVNNAGMYIMDMEQGPNKGQGPLDGARPLQSLPSPLQPIQEALVMMTLSLF